MRKKIYFFDLLRVVAAIAVVLIHVLGPYREKLGDIPDWEWMTVITFNSFSRWAVPVFIMITGALMLTDKRPIDGRYYIKRRFGKVFIPFLFWSVFYAFLSAFTLEGINFNITSELLFNLPFHETYYHLGFFYYFIPLYFIIPFFHWLVQNIDIDKTKVLVVLWLFCSALSLFEVDTFLNSDFLLYSGYLLFGYVLYQQRWPRFGFLILSCVCMLFITDYMVISESFANNEYTVGSWLSYKTLNTALIAGGVFVFCRYISKQISEKTRHNLSFVSQYTLGIYLLHPIFLWPLRHFDLYFINPILSIVIWTFVAAGLSLFASWLLSRSSRTAWLVP